jgi:hypothetical protein
MKYNSNEIETVLFNKQMSLYTKIDNLINQRFNELDPDMLSVLTRTLMDLDDRIQFYKKNLKHGELFGVTYHKNRKNKKLESISLVEVMKFIKKK